MDTHTYIYVFYTCCCLVTELSDSFATPWTVASLALLSMEFPRQEHWSRLPFPSPGDLPDPGIEPVSPVSPALAGTFFNPEPPGKPVICMYVRAHTHTHTHTQNPLLKEVLLPIRAAIVDHVL